ncbi:DUF1289 domain-containing protein [Rhodoferax sp.]|uniref:DUF1289 domain-containing protein n=1 Tax=Rhodoferax sp. TaxID=50421 RepID=UPI00374DDE96
MNLIASSAGNTCASGLKDLEVASPCVSVCQMDAAGVFCTGCWRTLDEIAGWSQMDAPAKRAVWALIAQRSRVA